MGAVRLCLWASRDGWLLQAFGTRTHSLNRTARAYRTSRQARAAFALIESTSARRVWGLSNRRLVRRFSPIPAWRRSWRPCGHTGLPRHPSKRTRSMRPKADRRSRRVRRRCCRLDWRSDPPSSCCRALRQLWTALAWTMAELHLVLIDAVSLRVSQFMTAILSSVAMTRLLNRARRQCSKNAYPQGITVGYQQTDSRPRALCFRTNLTLRHRQSSACGLVCQQLSTSCAYRHPPPRTTRRPSQSHRSKTRLVTSLPAA